MIFEGDAVADDGYHGMILQQDGCFFVGHDDGCFLIDQYVVSISDVVACHGLEIIGTIHDAKQEANDENDS